MTSRQAPYRMPGQVLDRKAGHGNLRKDGPRWGTTLGCPAATKSSSSSFLPLLIIVVLFGLFYVAIIRPQRNRQRQAAQTQNQVVPGQRIPTTAGIYGTVV